MANADPQSSPESRTLACLRICLTPGLGTRSATRLLRMIGNPEALDAHRPGDLVRNGIPEDVARALISDSSRRRARDEWERANSSGIRIFDIGHPLYPRLLGEISDPPLVLYVKGRLWNQPKPHISIVGSRRPSAYGVNCAEQISRDLAARGAVVVSGLARGIDTAAHQGALAGGSTLAVLGTGVDRIYPTENRTVAEAIIENGAITSEFPLGTLPLPQNFPRRNRILAGLSVGTLVVEAAERSGSLITARLALESNREVFAVPGPIHSIKSLGCHQLIQQGACLVTGWQDIADALDPAVVLTTGEAGSRTSDCRLSPDQVQLLKVLSPSEEISLEFLLGHATTPAANLYSAILDLEIRGLIRKLPGDRYVLNAIRPSD
jgi:DNA processing protein